jgi:hypothetical protein
MRGRFAFLLLLTALSAQGVMAGSPSGTVDADKRSACDEAAEAMELWDRLDSLHAIAARWLSEQPGSRQRAAGLLYRVTEIDSIERQIESSQRLLQEVQIGPDHPVGRAAIDGLDRAAADGEDLRGFDAAAFLDRFDREIRTARDGAALAWLAHACRIADIEVFCIDAGLDDAIVRHDGANLFSRAALYPDAGPERFTALVLEARETRTYEPVLLQTWFEALAAVDTEEPGLDAHDRLLGAYSVTLAYGIPGYALLEPTCATGVEPDSDHERACDRVLDDMAENGDTDLARLIPSAIRAERAEARGLANRAAAFDAEKHRIHERLTCGASAIETLLEAGDDATVRDYLKGIVDHGESEGRLRFAEAHGIECDAKPEAVASR